MPPPTNGRTRVTTSRNSYHISRSGCRTCKRRKVRCDESGPICQNCTSTGRVCDGVNDNKFVFVATTPPEQQQHSMRKSRSNSPTLALTPPRRQDELRSFDVYLKTAAPLFASGALDAQFWQKLIPAVSQHIKFAWNTAISIGLLFENPVHDIDHNVLLSSQLKPPQIQAVRWYSRAVTHSTEDLDRSSDRVLLALLSASLFVACEFQQANPVAAFNLLEHSQNLFRVCISPEALARPATPMTEALEEVLIPFCSRHLLGFAEFGVPPLIHHMDLYAVLKTESHGHPTTGSQIPGFESLHSELLTLLYRTHAIVRAVILIRHMAHEIGRTLPLKDALLVDLDDWYIHITSLPTTPATRPNQPTSLAYLLAYFHVARIQLITCHSLAESAYNAHTSSFQAIINQATSIISSSDINTPPSNTNPPSPNATSYPPFTYGIGPPLYLVATRCRHPVLRRTALSLLRQIPRPKEPNPWSILPIAQIAGAVVAFEEGSVGAAVALPDPSTAMLPDSGAPINLNVELPEDRLIHYTQLITRPRPPSRGGGGGTRELALRFITYTEGFEMRRWECDLVGRAAWGLT